MMYHVKLPRGAIFRARAKIFCSQQTYLKTVSNERHCPGRKHTFTFLSCLEIVNQILRRATVTPPMHFLTLVNF